MPASGAKFTDQLLLLQALEEDDGSSSENPSAEHEYQQYRQQYICGVGIDVADVHPAGKLREQTQPPYRWLKHPAVNDVDLAVFAPDRGAEMLCDRLGAVFDGRAAAVQR